MPPTSLMDWPLDLALRTSSSRLVRLVGETHLWVGPPGLSPVALINPLCLSYNIQLLLLHVFNTCQNTCFMVLTVELNR